VIRIQLFFEELVCQARF